MISDEEIQTKGMKVLIEALGLVDSARFVGLVRKDISDYTKWRRHLFEGMALEEINAEAIKHWMKKVKKENVT